MALPLIDHLALRVRDLERSRTFYEHALEPLGVRVVESSQGPGFVIDGGGDFWIGEGEPPAAPVHVAFAAADRAAVDEFHRAAVEAGGRDNGAPGLRLQYHAGYYAAFVIDPDGNNVEAVFHGDGQLPVPEGKARLPPRWFIKSFWKVHRRIVRTSGGRRGLWPPRPGKWGALRLTTTGRRSGEPRSVILGYYEDGSNLVSMAMNGWGAAEPAWWLNLQADPQAVVELAGGLRREVLGRPAVGEERERLWQRWRELDRNLDSYAARRPRETAVVVLEPREPAECSGQA